MGDLSTGLYNISGSVSEIQFIAHWQHDIGQPRIFLFGTDAPLAASPAQFDEPKIVRLHGHPQDALLDIEDFRFAFQRLQIQ